MESSSSGPGRAGNAPTLLRLPPGETHAPASFELLEVQLDEFDDGCYECEVLEADHFQMFTNTDPSPPSELPSSSASAPVYSDEVPNAKRARFCFDDSVDEPFNQRIDNDEAPASVTDEVPEAFSLRPKRRLNKKTAPQQTAFSDTPLANRTD